MGIQIARRLGASYIATTCSKANFEFVQSLRNKNKHTVFYTVYFSLTISLVFLFPTDADKIIDYTSTPNIAEALLKVDETNPNADQGFDIVYDTVGDSASIQLAKTVTKNRTSARFVTIAQMILPWSGGMFSGKGMSMNKFTMRFNADNLESSEVTLEGQNPLTIEIQQIFKLEEFNQAFNLLKSRRVRGKLVFEIVKDDDDKSSSSSSSASSSSSSS